MLRLFRCILAVAILPLSAAAAPNVLLICVDDLRPELGCYGVDYVQTPHIDGLASESRVFMRHYVQAPTCGASRYALLTGTFGPAGNGALFQRAQRLNENPDAVPPSLPAWFRERGYETVSVGKVSHHPGGRGGRDWNDPSEPEMPDSWDRHLMPTGPWQHPRGAMHGLANGEIRTEARSMAVFQAFDGPDTAYPDGLILETAIDELRRLAAGDKPFFLAVGIIRPHLPFGAPAKYLEPYREAALPPIPHPEKPDMRTTWHGSGEFMKYERWGNDPRRDAEFADEVRRHYAAAVSYADALVGRLLDEVSAKGLDENTIVVLWGDHGWHLGERSIWGKHALFEESLRSPLIIRAPEMRELGKATDAVVESIDLFPTLCQLAGVPAPDFVDGESLVPHLNDPSAAGGTAISYIGRAQTIRTDSHRLIVHDDGFRELYDHDSAAKETRNVADEQPELADQLARMLEERLRGDR